ncbi:Biosynthetic Aromatic amino acid aminotransferase beta [hydrothermal vent metagenome]|uniref:Biosynthetic Aromatic amino acid aminotransferase beta n=1 Tax=hydrothermal vent metagenome TaxID=652676 RepID=A0A3B1BW38_9ZZZZ
MVHTLRATGIPMSKPRENPFVKYTAPGISTLLPYISGKSVSELERELGIRDSVKLASNENPLGASPKAKAAVMNMLEELARYPDGGGFELRTALAKFHGIEADAVTLGNGSNDVLDLIASTFLSPGTEAVFSQHAFAVYPICTQAVGATARVAAAHDGSHGPCFGHDLIAMSKLVGDKTRVVFIANPNNPTGTWLASDELHQFIDGLPSKVIVVVDEAYVEYVEEDAYPDASQWLSQYPNLIVTRTFSKAYGLAALRIGYGLSHPDVAELLNRVRQPFNVNSLAQAAAHAALQDRDHIEQSIAVNRSGMAQLIAGFNAMGLEYIPSVGNFVCVDVGRSAVEVDAMLLREGCITRPIGGYGMPRHLRVTVGLEEENRRLIEAMQRVLG